MSQLVALVLIQINMIKFFRHIRKEQMEKGKTSKYFKYAFGEIILVVIGILIALQINNWNEANKETETEKVYIKNIIRDLNNQLKSIEIHQKREEEYFEVSQDILENYYETNFLTLDSAFFDKGTRLTIRVTFSINDPTFTDLVSSGNIKLIKDVVKKDQIIQYYQDLERIEKIIQNNNSLLVDQNFSQVYLKHGYLAPSAFEGYKLLISETKISNQLLSQSNKLKDLSSSLLTKKDELELLNAITQRHVVANGHINFMKTLKDLTQSLINTLEE